MLCKNCFMEMLNSTKLNESSGWIGIERRFELSGYSGSCPWGFSPKIVYYTWDHGMWGFLPESSLEDCHPGTKGPKFSPSEDASSATTWYNGSALTFSQRSRLRLLLSFSLHEGQGQKGCLSLVLNVQTLSRVKTNYLAVSPGTDILSSWSRMTTEAPNISIS